MQISSVSPFFHAVFIVLFGAAYHLGGQTLYRGGANDFFPHFRFSLASVSCCSHPFLVRAIRVTLSADSTSYIYLLSSLSA